MAKSAHSPKFRPAIQALAFASVAAAGLLLAGSASAFPQTAQNSKTKIVEPKITENDRIVHMLNRLAFGPRPDDIASVKKLGIKGYIEQQLNPDRIDDSAIEAKLKAYPELQLSDIDIESRYREFVEADQDAAKLRRSLVKMQQANAPMATDPPAAGQAVSTAPAPKQQAIREMVMADPDLAKQVEDSRTQLVKVAAPIALLHEEFVASKLIRAVESPRQLQEVLVDFWSNHFNIDIRKAPCGVLKVLDDRNTIRPHVFGKFRDLLEASAKSPAMLVYLDNFQSVSDTLPAFNGMQRRGRFGLQNRNLNQTQPAAAPVKPKAKSKLGLNENYARELMELHTLGVNGGYTQQDVREVARCFTGWGIGYGLSFRPANRYSEAGEFQFHPRLHDDGEKMVLGHRIPAGGGMRDGEIVLDMLANDPATRKHISYELCQRLVCDEPPYSLVSKCVETWQKTDGDLREVVKTIVTSPEFFSSVAVRKKIKSPFEYAVSAVRALNGTLDPDLMINQKQLAREANQLIRPPQGGGFLDINTTSLLGEIETMGEPLFQYQAPTGFPEDSRKWVSSGALISRLNFSLALTQGRLKDVKLDNLSEDAGSSMDPATLLDRMAGRILHGELSASTRATLMNEASTAGSKFSSGNELTPAQIAALLLGSPEFQRR
jgi:uncharacterized protein (DUF1800 family)